MVVRSCEPAFTSIPTNSASPSESQSVNMLSAALPAGTRQAVSSTPRPPTTSLVQPVLTTVKWYVPAFGNSVTGALKSAAVSASGFRKAARASSSSSMVSVRVAVRRGVVSAEALITIVSPTVVMVWPLTVIVPSLSSSSITVIVAVPEVAPCAMVMEAGLSVKSLSVVAVLAGSTVRVTVTGD